MKDFFKTILKKLIAHYLVETIQAVMALLYMKKRIIKLSINVLFTTVNQRGNSLLTY
ncbi:hypothetical protein [Arcobacter sp. F155]|uniref:hypothetical protein n=1 Tax=Arcobacter sp. F155 TaxID=2044512 RepID=UPI0013E8F7C3|nr:hypothetical protein [Arcobacter sp. F155]